ncbi:MAG: hypothetical protein PF541_10850 [Prolixibacteraceae bacterium]|jgi:bla regulator protein BlaR1|nr:hypothetical protein [Prolixibacteraceae bacterium]
MKTNFIEGLIAAGVIVIGLLLASFTVGNSIHPQVSVSDSMLENSEPNSNKELTLAEVQQEKKKAENRDSIWTVTKKQLESTDDLENVSEELEKVIEVALSEQNEEISAEMMEEINEALEGLDVGAIIQAAMAEAKVAMDEIDMNEIMEEAKSDIDFDEINRDLDEARREINDAKWEMREEMRREMEAEGDVPEEIIELSIQAAEAGLEVASEVIRNLPLQEIIEAALQGVEIAFEAIEDIDVEDVDRYDFGDDVSEQDWAELHEQLKEERAKEKAVKANELEELRTQLELEKEQLLKEKEQLQLEKDSLKKALEEEKLKLEKEKRKKDKKKKKGKS